MESSPVPVRISYRKSEHPIAGYFGRLSRSMAERPHPTQ